MRNSGYSCWGQTHSVGSLRRAHFEGRTVVGIVDLQLDMTVELIDAGRRQSRPNEDLGTSLRLGKGYDLQKGCFRVSGLTLGGDGTF